VSAQERIAKDRQANLSQPEVRQQGPAGPSALGEGMLPMSIQPIHDGRYGVAPGIRSVIADEPRRRLPT
jgi:hypothetical protein